MPQTMTAAAAGAAAGAAAAKPFITHNNVKWFADRGIDILPIPYTTKNPEAFMSRIHGLYLQGGPVYNADYIRTATRLLELAVVAQRRGEYFPVWGTCHGFQLLCTVFGDMELNELGLFDARNRYMANVHITRAGLHSRIARAWPDGFKAYLERGRHVYFANYHGITPEAFLANSRLRHMFVVVGISHDRDRKRFVSMIEAKGGLPFYGTQFHPETVAALEPFRSFFVNEVFKNHKKKRSRFVRTFRQRHLLRHCTRNGRIHHNRFQDSECYFL